jgi:hypothetical protein
MNNPNPSRKMAARQHAGCFLALFMLFGMPAALIPALLMLFLAGGATASAQVVTNTADSGPGTLRSAITNAADGAVITFDPSLSGATITLSNTLTINTNLTIDASALSGGLQINGNGSVQIFNAASNTFVFLNSLTIANGYSTNSGGGIYNGGTLTLNNCTLSGNSVAIFGGGIDNVGALTLNQSTLSGNSAADTGGGIFNAGALTLNQCTLSGNSAEFDGGGGIWSRHGTLAMTNTIVAGNNGSAGAADIYGYFLILTYGGSNLVQSVNNVGGTTTGPAPLTNAPNLAPLGSYGGPTQTMPPLPGSPAIGAGSVAANTLSTDQRGFSRMQNGLIDLGAVELQSPAANPPVLENITVPAGGGTSGLQFTFTNAPVADFTVLTATDVSLALTNWTVLGEVQQVAPGQYQFTDLQAATNMARFYRVRSPYRVAWAYTVGGTLTGIPAGDTVTLQDNGSDNLTLSTNGTFTFPTALPDGHAYSVTVSGTSGATPLAPLTCTVKANGSGTISGANVTNVAVQCTHCPAFTGNMDVDMYNAAVSDGTANGGVPAVMVTENGGPFRVTARGLCTDNVAGFYSAQCVVAQIVGTTSCSSTTLPSGAQVIQFGPALVCGPGPYGY